MNFKNHMWSYNHHQNQYAEQFPHPEKALLPQSVLTSLSPPLASGNHISVTSFAFFLEFYIHEKVVCVQLFSLA